MKSFLTILTLLFFVSLNANAGAPGCSLHGSSPYCQYTGKVNKIYINSGNLILIYFDTALDLTRPANVGIEGVSQYAAAAYFLNDNKDFGNLLYSTALTAQASGRNVAIQMRGSRSGYLLIDRIWLAEQE